MLTNDQLRSLCNGVEFHFGVLRRGLVVYKSKWISTYQSAYVVDSEHETEAQAQLRVDEIIGRGMIGMTKAELEQVAVLRSLDKWRESAVN